MKKTVFTFFYNVLQRRKYGEIYNFLGCLIVTIKKFGNGLLRFSTREQVNSVVFSAVDYGSSGQVEISSFMKIETQQVQIFPIT